MTSSLAVAEFAMEKLHEHLHEGLEPLPADVLKDAGVNADSGRIVLTHAQATNHRVFTAAQSVAEQRGVELQVEVAGELPHSVPTNNGSGGNGAG